MASLPALVIQLHDRPMTKEEADALDATTGYPLELGNGYGAIEVYETGATPEANSEFERLIGPFYAQARAHPNEALLYELHSSKGYINIQNIFRDGYDFFPGEVGECVYPSVETLLLRLQSSCREPVTGGSSVCAAWPGRTTIEPPRAFRRCSPRTMCVPRCTRHRRPALSAVTFSTSSAGPHLADVVPFSVHRHYQRGA